MAKLNMFKCDKCGAIIEKPHITTEAVPNEGYSTITRGKKSYDVGEQDFCSDLCLLNDLKDKLGLEITFHPYDADVTEVD